MQVYHAPPAAGTQKYTRNAYASPPRPLAPFSNTTRGLSPQQPSGEATDTRGEVRDLKKSLSFFPALGHRPVVENYSCQKNTHRLSGNRLHRFQIKRAGSPQGGSQAQMLATVSRRAPPAALRKESRGKTFGGPCQASVAARSGVLFFILRH